MKSASELFYAQKPGLHQRVTMHETNFSSLRAMHLANQHSETAFYKILIINAL